MMDPRVSVVIPAHNSAVTVARAIDSALEQRSPALEIIVVDDCSADGTPGILAAYGERIRVRRLHRRSGPAVARNAGAAIAGGAYLAFLDADDRWLPNFLDAMVAALEESPASVLAFSDIIPVDGSDAPAAHFLRAGEPRYAPSMDDLLTRWWPILPSAGVIRRRAFELCGGFADEFAAPGNEDVWLWLRACEQGEFSYIDEPLVMYRMAPEFLRMCKYAAGFRIFSALVIQRYGADGRRLISNLRAAFTVPLAYAGLLHLRLGNRSLARASFACALRYDPSSLRNALRYFRTFLPCPLAAALSGRTGLLSYSAARTALSQIPLAATD
jgi:glycosyltransferase involved in cell wall biosynthesis